jgi:hypothetical protein
MAIDYRGLRSLTARELIAALTRDGFGIGSVCLRGRIAGKAAGRLKGGCGQGCPPHKQTDPLPHWRPDGTFKK